MLKTIDLFAGAGGLSYGFKLSGYYDIVAAAENNKNAQRTYIKNIVGNNDEFKMIDNVIGFDFANLNNELGGIDVVIGGPPCQGFSNANRNRTHIVSSNNELVKEYFRAIKEIKPKAFVMENVSMLQSESHRFYESQRDYEEISSLLQQGFNIPKRTDSLFLADQVFEGINIETIVEDVTVMLLPERLRHSLSVLKKNLNNNHRLTAFLENHSREIIVDINDFIRLNEEHFKHHRIIQELKKIYDSIVNDSVETAVDSIVYVNKLQKLCCAVLEIDKNGLIGQYGYDENSVLRFNTNSYSVIDYINAILGGEYIQKGCVLNAKNYGVPQDRRRYIAVGIRKDIYENAGCNYEYPKAIDAMITVGQAINDLAIYPTSFDPDMKEIEYQEQEGLSNYAIYMRENSSGVNNHIIAKTREKALERFEKIEQGKNFHSLDEKYKDTYSNPGRTQNTIYLRLDPTKVCGTVVNVRKSMWIHPTLNRAISVREAARLQSFDDSFIFCGPKDSQYQQVGNAVPPLLALSIANSIKEIIKDL